MRKRSYYIRDCQNVGVRMAQNHQGGDSVRVWLQVNVKRIENCLSCCHRYHVRLYFPFQDFSINFALFTVI